VDPAVETGIDVLAESELSPLEHFQIFLALLFDSQGNGKRSCAGLDDLVAEAEAGIEGQYIVEGQNVEAQALHQVHRNRGVEAAGKHDEAFHTAENILPQWREEQVMELKVCS